MKNAAKLRRNSELARRERKVNYPELKPGESAIGLRREHGKNTVKITRLPHPERRSKYGRIAVADMVLPTPVTNAP